MTLFSNSIAFFAITPNLPPNSCSTLINFGSYNKMLPKKTLFILVFLLSTTSTFAQFDNWGVTGGLTFNYGSTLQRLGLFFGGYYYEDHVQVNLNARFHRNFKSYGPTDRQGNEWQIHAGLVYSYGNIDSVKNQFLSEVSSQMAYKNSIGYAYNVFIDQIKTSQNTGTISWQLDKFNLIIENDILGSPGSDQFRTGAFLLSYNDGQNQLAISNVLWTGNPHSEQTVLYDSCSFARFGYKDISKAPYGGYSNGILKIQYRRAFDIIQHAGFDIGIDAEQIRNVIQNKIMHDFIFWPAKWNPVKNKHLPMVDSEGNAYIYEEGQKIRPAKFYWDMNMNSVLTY
ncbi:polymorphic toxin type 23 domain-containing protein [Flammeovirgaceae bacterium SG7u.111]|nr:polymorphic toxin type 23 domain-containing protein [Flammeovirgaceae bacterium SG7u.132]WPO34824.1 polymorphic toxin type 23 domain-containing protein [Flammeovirgaceae bacterium SG7u.111]